MTKPNLSTPQNHTPGGSQTSLPCRHQDAEEFSSGLFTIKQMKRLTCGYHINAVISERGALSSRSDSCEARIPLQDFIIGEGISWLKSLPGMRPRNIGQLTLLWLFANMYTPIVSNNVNYITLSM
jgi:hypothetical protein